VKTKWIAWREFSASPGRALAAVSRAGRVLVTANGKSKAIMTPTSEGAVASDLERLDRVDLARSIAANEPSSGRAPRYHKKGLCPDASGRHPSPQQAAENCAVQIRSDAVTNGTDSLSMKEIDAEVAAVRTARRRRSGAGALTRMWSCRDS